ncbi:transcriptional regulator, TetR family [Seinonella peptonophila]|uniref:Transcriptional regulator, TetR family n=1 Tax=Seinonella peptonophila TaxID=112248 RepID=A0A1M4T516_9BACL|nr:TetR/AcrR family transcriptional regulator [Seinonella peptonophila]SHE39491.1 transcriptional regulator, TetR family [Seinonella peptonophila]
MNQKQKSLSTISKLIDTGYRLFALKGFTQTSINDIVQEAGYSKGAFYAHFSSKEEFLIQVISERVQGYFKKLESILYKEEREMVELFAIYSAELATQAYKESLSAILFELVVTTNQYPHAKKMLIDLFENWRASLAYLLQQFQQKKLIRNKMDARILANTAISVFHGFLLQNYLDERVAYLDFVPAFLQLIDPIDSI